MKTKKYYNYIEFLKKAKEFEKVAKDIRYYDNILFSFKTNTECFKYVYDNNVLTPNKFCNILGINNYMSFVNKRFSKLKEFANNKKELEKWHGGFLGGLIGVNSNIVNKYLATGEVFEFYDYDINKAYLKQMTDWLPTKFLKTITLNQYNDLNEMDKMPYIYFFEIILPVKKTKFLKSIGTLRGAFEPLDFLNAKQNEHIVISERRLSLINQIYMKNYTIEKVFVFKKERFKLYDIILNEYLRVKDNYPEKFKSNALRLYGTLGQMYKSKPRKFNFENNGNLIVSFSHKENFDCSPQVAMWIADSVALRLFDIIQNNFENIICWNTDGLTSLKPLGLQISKQPGKWKLKKFKGIPLLFNDMGCRLFFKNVENGEFYGANNIIEKSNKIYEKIEFICSNLNVGLLKRIKFFEIDKTLEFKNSKTFRNNVLRRQFIEQISKEEEKF